MQRMSRQKIAWFVVLTVSFIFRIVLIQQNPTVYSYDAFTRIWERDALIVRHWLPVAQVPVFFGAHLLNSLFVMRLFCAAAGSLGAITFGLAVSRHINRSCGLICALLVSFLPGFVVHSIVPYQEGWALLFSSLALLGWPAGKEERAVPWWAAVSLLLAVWCRYEPWLLTLILLCGSFLRKNQAGVRACMPALLGIVLWLLSRAWLPSAEGPPRPIPADAFHIDERLSNIQQVLTMLPPIFLTGLTAIVQSMTWLGWGLFPWGIFQMKDRKDLFAREILVFAILVFILSLLRIINVQTITGRILMLPVLWFLPYFSFAIVDLAQRIPRGFGKVIVILVPLVLCGIFVSKTTKVVRESSDAWRAEARAAEMLTKLPHNVSVSIQPRFDRRWNESTIGGIFAQSLKLNPKDDRWKYHGKPSMDKEEPSLRLIWQNRGYRLEKLSR